MIGIKRLQNDEKVALIATLSMVGDEVKISNAKPGAEQMVRDFVVHPRFTGRALTIEDGADWLEVLPEAWAGSRIWAEEIN